MSTDKIYLSVEVIILVSVHMVCYHVNVCKPFFFNLYYFSGITVLRNNSHVGTTWSSP